MLKLFYHTKNIIGLIFLLIPSIGFLFYSSSVSSPFLLMASITLGIPSGRILYSRLSFSFWLCFMTIVCSYSIFIQAYFPATTAAYAACALLGFCSGGLLFILPPNITAGWFYTNKFQTLGNHLQRSHTVSLPLCRVPQRKPGSRYRSFLVVYDIRVRILIG